MQEFTVKLKLKVDTENNDHPATWNWTELLDLAIDEEVEVEVVEGEEAPGDFSDKDWAR